MFDTEILQWLNAETIFGWTGGVIITALLTVPLTSFFKDKMKRSLKQWEKVGTAFVAAFVVAMAWGLRTGVVPWLEIPGNVITYGTVSCFVYENFIKRYFEKKASQE